MRLWLSLLLFLVSAASLAAADRIWVKFYYWDVSDQAEYYYLGEVDADALARFQRGTEQEMLHFRQCCYTVGEEEGGLPSLVYLEDELNAGDFILPRRYILSLMPLKQSPQDYVEALRRERLGLGIPEAEAQPADASTDTGTAGDKVP